MLVRGLLDHMKWFSCSDMWWKSQLLLTPWNCYFGVLVYRKYVQANFPITKIFPLIRMNVNGNVRQKRQLSSRQAPLSDSFKFNNFLLFLPYSWAISKTQSSKLLFVLNVLTNRAKDPFHSKKQWKENSWTKYRHYITCVW